MQHTPAVLVTFIWALDIQISMLMAANSLDYTRDMRLKNWSMVLNLIPWTCVCTLAQDQTGHYTITLPAQTDTVSKFPVDDMYTK